MAKRTYTELQALLNSNLQKWNSFISVVSSVISQYQTTIESLLSLIDDNESEIEGLKYYILHINDSSVEDGRLVLTTYVRLNTNSLNIQNNSSTDTVSKASIFRVYSNAPRVYAFASKTISGLTVNGNIISDTSTPFMFFVGSQTGDTLEVIATNVKKTDNMIISFNTTGNSTDPMNASINIGIQYKLTTYNNTDKPIVSITDLANKFKNAANALNGLSVDSDTISKLTTSTSTNTTLESQETVNNLTSQLLGGTSTIGMVVKKS